MSLYGMPQMIADQPVWSPLQGLMPGIEQGTNVGLKAQHAHAALLQNRLLQQQLQTQPQLAQAQIARLNAQAQAQAQGAAAGPSLPPGVAGQWAQLEKYKQQFGENSPEYQQLYHALAAQQHMSAQRGNYYAALANTIGQRYSPTQQRAQVFAQLMNMGYPASRINTLNDQQRAAIVANNIPYSHYAAALAQQQGNAATPITQAQTPGLPSANQLPQGRTIDASAQSITQAPQIGLPTTQPPPTGMASDVAQALAPQAATPQASQIGLPQSPSAMLGAGQLQQDALQQANQARIKQLSAQQAQQAQSAVFKTTTTTDQQNRLAGAARAIPSLQMMAQNAPLALQYAGIAGKSKKLAAQLRQSNSPSYLAYKQYKQAQAIAEQDTALALGIKATDKAFDAYKPLFNVDSWDVNPQQASALFNNMTSLIHKESQKNAMTLQQQRQLIRGNVPAQVPGGTSAEAPSAPTFQNKQQFLSWYNGLSSAQQHAYKQSKG